MDAKFGLLHPYLQCLRLHPPGLLPSRLSIHLPGAPQVHIARLAVLAPGCHPVGVGLGVLPAPPRQRSQNMRLLGIVDIQPVLAQHADLEGDLLQRLPAKTDRQGIRWLDEKRTKRHWNCHI